MSEVSNAQSNGETPKPEEDVEEKRQNEIYGVWIATGVAMGVAMGVALNNIAIGIALGMAVGIAIAAVKIKQND